MALSGGLGLVGGAVLTGVALFLWQQIIQNPLLTRGWVWLLLAFLLGFSLAEIPIMVIGMRHMLGSSAGVRLAILTNAAFTLFAAVYAAPFLLLTGRVAIALALAGLGLVRLAVSLWFVPLDRPPDQATPN
ncbi:MAG: hypothetical protein Kow0063_43790 [Anaerolineae bacterium]